MTVNNAIERADGLAERVDVFYAAGRLTGTEYSELSGLLSEAQAS